MSHPDKPSSISPHLQQEDSSALADWLVYHKKSLFTVITVLFALLFFWVYLLSGKQKQEIRDYEQAEYLAQSLDDPEATNPLQTAEDLKAIIASYPSLQRQYDGMIAQEYLLQNDRSGVDPYAQRAISQLQSVDLMHFAQFSEITRLCNTEEKQKALELALDLKSKVENEPKKYQRALLACTLLQIAALHEKLGNSVDQNHALSLLDTLVKQASRDEMTDSIQMPLQQLFKEDNQSIIDYFQTVQK